MPNDTPSTRQELLQALQAMELEKLQLQDLLFALLHTLGPKITIVIDDYQNTMQHATYSGNVSIDDSGRYSCDLTFSLNQAPTNHE